MTSLLLCTVLIMAPPEPDTVEVCISSVSCVPTQPNQVARFFLRADASDLSGNVSDLSALAAEVSFDIADIACWRRLLAGESCGERQPVEMIGPTFLGPGVRQELANGGNDEASTLSDPVSDPGTGLGGPLRRHPSEGSNRSDR